MINNRCDTRLTMRGMRTDGEHDLQKLLKNCNPALHNDEFVFVTLRDREIPARVHAQCLFRESEGLTVIVRRGEAEREHWPWTFPCRMITLQVHSALDAVGFLARVMAVLSAHGISTNTVSAYYHDHLFVPVDRAEEALHLLRNLSG